MSEIVVKAINPTVSELRKYVKFGIDLYRGNPYYVPPLVMDDVNTLNPKKNPAFDFCEAQSFVAMRDGRTVGTITGIINHVVNERVGEKTARFGFLEFVDSEEVADALFSAVEAWGKERGMTQLVGPMGFTDLDHEGMLIEGFEEAGTMATIYNPPYYPRHMERMGFEKEADWIEYRIAIPTEIPAKHQRIANMVKERYNLQVKKYTSRKKLKEEYGQAIFDLVNEAYDKLFGYSPLTQRQIDYYIAMYLGILRLEDVSLITEADGTLVCVGVSMPSMSAALRKSRGRLFPTGWYHLLRALKGHTDVVDLLLVAARPDYLGKGVNALLFSDLIPYYIKHGYKYAESNPELEGNENVQRQWEYFERRQHRRRRAWKRPIK